MVEVCGLSPSVAPLELMKRREILGLQTNGEPQRGEIFFLFRELARIISPLWDWYLNDDTSIKTTIPKHKNAAQ